MFSPRNTIHDLVISLRNIAFEQRITNLIVCAQLAVDAGEKTRLLNEAKRRIARHDPADQRISPGAHIAPEKGYGDSDQTPSPTVLR